MIIALFLLFTGFNFADLFLTISILSAGGNEANPVIHIIYRLAGIPGIVVFKLLFVIFVGWLTTIQFFMELELIAANIIYFAGVMFIYQEYKKSKNC